MTTFHVGDVVSVPSRNTTYDIEQALAGTGCLTVQLQEARDDVVLQFDVGAVVAVSTTCPGGAEIVAVRVRDSVVATRAADVRKLDPACLPAVAAMVASLEPRWTQCAAKSRWRHDLADVSVTFTATGAVADVGYRGGTSWGEKVALCIINATKRTKLDGRACAGETVRLAEML